MTRTGVPGRGWAYTGATLGGLVSIAANVAHSFVPPPGTAAGWAPEPGAVVGAIVWPVFLFVAVEILARVAWPQGRTWQVVRWAGLLPVAVVAAFVSYRHLSGLLTHYGEEDLVAVLGPLAVDGLMVMSTGALIATGRRRTQPSASEPAAAPAAPTVVPPAPTVVPTTVPSTAVDPPPVPPDPASVPTTPAPVPVPTPAVLAHRVTGRPATPAASATPPAGTRPARTRPATPTPTAGKPAPSTTDTSVTASDAAQLTLPVVAPELAARAARVAAEYRTEHGTPITAGQLAVRLKVTSEVAAQALAALNTPTDHSSSTVNGTPVRANR